MLKQNMRQIKKGDEKFRTMLENMRYKDCTWSDIEFLRSRISSTVPGRPSVCSKEFRNVSVITTRNLLKDTMNTLGSKRFAEETGQKLSYFYSEDEIAMESNNSDRPRIKGKTHAHVINKDMQRDLWHQMPSTTKKHVAGRLGLCVGMPVLIRNNSATELGITNGQEAAVHAWQTALGMRGQPILDAVFVELIKPPAPVKLPGLPLNIVPILPTTNSQLLCSLRGGTKVLINRTQVEMLPNFAMTDFASQGKTRDFNVVDLQACRSHQSMYTALSRGTCAEGTILLRDFSPSIVMNGISGRQRQEFRELALLDEITDLRYNGNLPVGIFGIHRKELIASYRAWKGNNYVPEEMHKSLQWNTDRPWMEDDTPHLEWELIDTDSDLKKGKNKVQEEKMDPFKLFVRAVGSNTLKRKLDIKDEYNGVMPVKKSRIARTENPDRDMDKMEGEDEEEPEHMLGSPPGSQWSNNSCAYDSLLCILYHIWNDDPSKWSAYFQSPENRTTTQAFTPGFQNCKNGISTLEEVRDDWRHDMNRFDSDEFEYGGFCSVLNLIDTMFAFRNPVCTFIRRCINCNNTRRNNLSRYTASILVTCDTIGSSVQSWISGTASTIAESNTCSTCQQEFSARVTLADENDHILFVTFAEHNHIEVNRELNIPVGLGQNTKCYSLVGLIYYGGAHFTSRIIQNQSVWYHDGMTTGTMSSLEGQFDEIEDLLHRGTKCLVAAVYIVQ